VPLLLPSMAPRLQPMPMTPPMAFVTPVPPILPGPAAAEPLQGRPVVLTAEQLGAIAEALMRAMRCRHEPSSSALAAAAETGSREQLANAVGEENVTEEEDVVEEMEVEPGVKDANKQETKSLASRASSWRGEAVEEEEPPWRQKNPDARRRHTVPPPPPPPRRLPPPPRRLPPPPPPPPPGAAAQHKKRSSLGLTQENMDRSKRLAHDWRHRKELEFEPLPPQIPVAAAPLLPPQPMARKFTEPGSAWDLL
jgi:hypothetical protein